MLLTLWSTALKCWEIIKCQVFWTFLKVFLSAAMLTPEELAARRKGYANLYQGSLLARNRDQTPLSVRGAEEAQDFIPVVGDVLALGEAGGALSRGELAAAGLLGAGAIVGLVPGAGDVVAKPIMAAGRKAADVARSPAQKVADLLASGRADEVTSEMLGKLTPMIMQNCLSYIRAAQRAWICLWTRRQGWLGLLNRAMLEIISMAQTLTFRALTTAQEARF